LSIRSLACAKVDSAIRCGSVRWHAVEVNLGGQEVLPRPSMRTSRTAIVDGRWCRSEVFAARLSRYRQLRLLQFAAALLHALTLNRQWHDRAKMSDIGLTVPGMTEPPRRYDVTVTVDQDGGHHPRPRRVRRGGSAGGIGQSGQHRQRAYGRADRQHRHSSSRRSARGRGCRPGRRIRRAKASCRVVRSLTGP
jgi:hypothetical protein